MERVHQPVDFRHVGLHRTAAHILGLDPAEAPPRLAVKDEGRPIAEKYVVIATQASSQCKYWNNPFGWREIVNFLKQAGYRVICIDQKPVNGAGIVWNHIPAGAEDKTGELTLEDCVRWIRHAEFFVGLSSGLAWLAWAAGAPRRHDQRLQPSEHGIRDALPGHQLPRLRRLLERPDAALQPPRLSLVSPPRGNAAPFRMHPPDHRGTGETDHPAHPGIFRTRAGEGVSKSPRPRRAAGTRIQR